MRILLNLTQLNLKRTGIDVYTERVAVELVRMRKPADEIFVLALDDDAQLLDRLHEAGEATIILLPARPLRNRILPLLFEQVALPWLVWKHKMDALHCFRFNFPLLKVCPRVVTIHDFSAFLWPETVPLFRRRLVRAFTRLALRRAECVVFVSESARLDAEKMFGRSDQTRVVTPLGVDPQPPELHSAGQARPGIEQQAPKNVSMLFDQPPFLLFIGTMDPRKNLSRLVQAFDHVADRYANLRLVLVGHDTGTDLAIAAAVDASPHRARIQRIGFISDDQKQRLLRACAALVYPSLYEGFGLPVLEGMAAGAPVITSNTSSMPEVAGDAAICVDPTSVIDIARQIERVLGDEALRQTLIQAGAVRVRQFTWRKTAESTYSVYESVTKRMGSSA